MFFAALILLSVAVCAAWFGPYGPSGPPDPTIIQTSPRPDFFFLWLYAVLSFLPPSMETPALLIGPVVGILALVLLPFLFGEGEKSWRRRPVAVLTVLLVAVALGTFTRLAEHTPWSPIMDAWSGDPIPPEFLHSRSALERQGALVFQAKAVPQLPFARRSRRKAWPGSRRRGRATDARSTHPAGDSRGREHARVWKKSKPGGDHGAGGIPRNAASRWATACTERLACPRNRTGYRRALFEPPITLL